MVFVGFYCNLRLFVNGWEKIGELMVMCVLMFFEWERLRIIIYVDCVVLFFVFDGVGKFLFKCWEWCMYYINEVNLFFYVNLIIINLFIW